MLPRFSFFPCMMHRWSFPASALCNLSPLTFPLTENYNPPPPPMEKEVADEEQDYYLIPEPADWFSKLVCFFADFIYNCIFSPFILFFSIASDTYRRGEEATAKVESMVHKVPANITRSSTIVLKKLGFGVVGAVYVCIVLLVLFVSAMVLGVCLVKVWVEEPVFLREKLYFDYTDAHPKAVFSFASTGWFDWKFQKRKQMDVPVGHTFYVSLVLLMPESYFNREIGVFQLTAELLSANGCVIAKSSQPCMLRYRSLPIRLTRTFIMGIPLVLGISSEAQTITVEILKHKEGYPRTKAIRFALIPRSGTSFLPQLYEAEMVINSQLPWFKEFVRNWKWTFYVWTWIYLYIMSLVLLMCCCRPLVFPVMTTGRFDEPHNGEGLRNGESKESEAMVLRDEREVSEMLRKWQQRRSKRKAIFLHGELSETVGSSASSISISRDIDDTSTVAEEGTADSESVCLGG